MTIDAFYFSTILLLNDTRSLIRFIRRDIISPRLLVISNRY